MIDTGRDLTVRRASPDDLDEILALAERRRRQYEEYQPRFWRAAEDAMPEQRAFFRHPLDDDRAAVLVARLRSAFRGCIITRVLSAPPVYDPGALTCMVDDFAVVEPTDWPEVGPALLEAARRWGADRGAVQMVVVTAHLDEPKRALLRDARLTLASEWWTGPVA